ncbi:MAG: hypothetical protein LBJ80_00200 [Rickettsiales bacterium]|jgi:hypothetical protein|nr:hypothetical protein [Rickettsiales bacterium]
MMRYLVEHADVLLQEPTLHYMSDLNLTSYLSGIFQGSNSEILKNADVSNLSERECKEALDVLDRYKDRMISRADVNIDILIELNRQKRKNEPHTTPSYGI